MNKISSSTHDSPPPESGKTNAQYGDLAQFIGPRGKKFITRLKPEGVLQTHNGVLKHDDLIGKPWGSQVYSHLNKPFYMLQPSLHDLLLNTRRVTTIMYPKDIGFILVTMGIGPGTHVLEAGTGSGGFTTALAYAVGPQGHVYSYENRPQMQDLAHKNLVRLGLDDRVTFKIRDVEAGFDETDVDALFYDLPNPEDYIPQAREALKSGGFFGSLLPTSNQVSRLLKALDDEDFAFLQVCETLLRYYKPVHHRLRPYDRMVAHTGFLIFGRPMIMAPGTDLEIDDEESPEEPTDD
jgi:tRNA (adenine57-N1/adenine58-N1)-methyltransferase